MPFILIYYLLLNLFLSKPLGKSADKWWKICFLYPHSSLIGLHKYLWGVLSQVGLCSRRKKSLGGTSRNDQTCFLKDFFIINFKALACRICSRCGNNNCNRKRSLNMKQSGEHSNFQKERLVLHAFPDFWVGLALCLWIERLSAG